MKIMETMSGRLSLKPIEEKRFGFYLLGILLTCLTIYWLYHCARLLIEGHLILGTDSYGATWGITVTNIVHIIGISHVGIAISATVRVLNLRQYSKVARIAEFVTLIALITAVINIGLDVGRPDRFITETLIHGKWYTPMVWSMTVIILYFLASSTYLYLSLRRDLWSLSASNLRFRRFYKIMAFGYEDTVEERDRHDHTLFWLAISLIPIMISVHSVYGLFFGLLPAKAGWFNPLQAPYFVLGAIVSGFSAIIVVAAFLRWAYSWGELLPDRTFRVFGSFLAFVVFLYLYFIASEQLTIQYSSLPAEKAVSSSLLFGDFSNLFWMTTLIGLILPFIILFIQGIKKGAINIGLTAVAALFINVAMWLKRYLIVVPAQYNFHLPLPRDVGPYVPSYTELVVTFGSYAFAVLVFLVLLKLVPLVEMPLKSGKESTVERRNRSFARGLTMLLTLFAGVSMIVWGILTLEYDYAPVKWLIGLLLLTMIPLEKCLIKDTPCPKIDTA
jgi:molybdopterin-containing oxidoreductase family membrane subunit